MTLESWAGLACLILALACVAAIYRATDAGEPNRPPPPRRRVEGARPWVVGLALGLFVLGLVGIEWCGRLVG